MTQISEEHAKDQGSSNLPGWFHHAPDALATMPFSPPEQIYNPVIKALKRIKEIWNNLHIWLEKEI